jgi:chromosome segregation ATPase
MLTIALCVVIAVVSGAFLAYYVWADTVITEGRATEKEIRQQLADKDGQWTAATAEHDKVNRLHQTLGAQYDDLYTEFDDLQRDHSKLKRDYSQLEDVCHDLADKLAALSAHEALVIDREELPTWAEATGVHPLPVGPDALGFTEQWNLTDVAALRDRFDNAEQRALTVGAA